MNEYDVFLSYSGDHGRQIVGELAEKLDAYGIRIYFDKSSRDQIPLGSDLQNELKDKIVLSRYFIPVITEKYHVSRWTPVEAEYALSHDCVIVPVYAVTRDSLDWYVEGLSWFPSIRTQVALDFVDAEVAGVAISLAEKAGIGEYIRTTCDSVVKAEGVQKTLETWDALVHTHAPSGLQKAIVVQYRANLLRLAGRIKDARIEIAGAARLLNINSLPKVVGAVCLTKSQLHVDDQNYEEARAALTEAIMYIGASESMKTPGASPVPRSIRVAVLGDISRELARICIEEAKQSSSPRNSSRLLEEAWILYFQSLAMLSITDQPESVGWVYDNLGDLLSLYAEVGRELPKLSHLPVISTLPESLHRLRGRSEILYDRARFYLNRSYQIFSSFNSRLGMGWSQYHLGEVEWKTANGLEAKWIESERLLTQAKKDFGSVAEGVGLCNQRLYWVQASLGKLDTASESGLPAIEYCKSRKHLVDEALRIENDMKERGLI